MDEAEYVVAGAVAVIVLATLVSGPLVGAVDFTGESDGSFSPGEGNATVSVLETPARAEIRKSSYGAGTYRLDVPDSVVDLQSVSGTPVLVYKLRIPEIGHTRGTTHFLDSSQSGRTNVTIERGSIDPDEIDESRYDGELVLLLRATGGERTLFRGNVTVEVEE